MKLFSFLDKHSLYFVLVLNTFLIFLFGWMLWEDYFYRGKFEWVNEDNLLMPELNIVLVVMISLGISAYMSLYLHHIKIKNLFFPVTVFYAVIIMLFGCILFFIVIGGLIQRLINWQIDFSFDLLFLFFISIIISVLLFLFGLFLSNIISKKSS